MTDLPPRVLVIGLDLYRIAGAWDPAPVAARIQAGLARFAEHGVGVEACLLGLDGSDDVEEVVARRLRAEPWECVVIGGGLPGPEDQVELFELVINLVRQLAPQAALAFNRTPGKGGAKRLPAAAASRVTPSRQPPGGSAFRTTPERCPRSAGKKWLYLVSVIDHDDGVRGRQGSNRRK